MVIKGNVGFYIADLTETESNGTITESYANFLRAAKAVRFELNPNEADNNDFYADNELDETAPGTADADVTMEVNGLKQEASKALLGLVEEELPEIAGITDTVKVLVYDDRQQNTPKGMATIIENQDNGVSSYTVVLLPKVKFQIPAEAAQTRGSTITWQTKTINGKAMRARTGHRRWQEQVTFTTLQQAILYVRHRFNADAEAAGA